MSDIMHLYNVMLCWINLSQSQFQSLSLSLRLSLSLLFMHTPFGKHVWTITYYLTCTVSRYVHVALTWCWVFFSPLACLQIHTSGPQPKYLAFSRVDSYAIYWGIICFDNNLTEGFSIRVILTAQHLFIQVMNWRLMGHYLDRWYPIYLYVVQWSHQTRWFNVWKRIRVSTQFIYCMAWRYILISRVFTK